MIENDRSDLTSLLNASGFLLQLGLEAVQPFEPNGDDFVIREHPWSIGDQSGSVDLIIGNGRMRFVIECKRPRGGQWLFVLPKDGGLEATRGTMHWVDYYPGRRNLSGFDDFHMKPTSPESDICIVRGQSDDQKPLLERIGHILLCATEAIGSQELATMQGTSMADVALLVPILVTSADLFVCKIDPELVSLSSGTIEEVDFVPVPWVRFRKALVFEDPTGMRIGGLGEVNKRSQRTLFVVNSKKFKDFLSSWSLIENQFAPRRPWNQARALELNEELAKHPECGDGN